MIIKRNIPGKLLVGLFLTFGPLLGFVAVWLIPHPVASVHALHEEVEDPRVEQGPVTVKVIKAKVGGLDRTTTQPGTVHAFEKEDLYATVPGFLKNQKVDIGSKVKKGEILAEIDAPDLIKEAERDEALLKKAQADVVQKKAAIEAARADVDVAQIAIDQKKAENRRAKSNLGYRQKQYDRVQDLANSRSVDQRLVDEHFDFLESAQAWVDAADAGIKTATAEVAAKKARLAQAEADLLGAEANIRVAQATLDKARVFVNFTKIPTHFDGIVTQSNFYNGNYLRALDQGSKTPLLQVQRTDLMRVLVQIPDTDAIYCDVGDTANLSFKSLSNDLHLPSSKVSRTSGSLNKASRTMQVEIDVPNEKGILKDGMYCEVTINLESGKREIVRVPSSAIFRKNGMEWVFVVNDLVLRKFPVEVGLNNGSVAEIIKGIKGDEGMIVVNPTGVLKEGQKVNPVMAD